MRICGFSSPELGVNSGISGFLWQAQGLVVSPKVFMLSDWWFSVASSGTGGILLLALGLGVKSGSGCFSFVPFTRHWLVILSCGCDLFY